MLGAYSFTFVIQNTECQSQKNLKIRFNTKQFTKKKSTEKKSKMTLARFDPKNLCHGCNAHRAREIGTNHAFKWAGAIGLTILNPVVGIAAMTAAATDGVNAIVDEVHKNKAELAEKCSNCHARLR